MSAVADQKTTALIIANSVRTSQRRWKDEVALLSPARARREAARVLVEDPSAVGALTVHAFLIALPRVGERQAKKLLTRDGWYVWPFRRVRELTLRQRQYLAEELLRR